jgi:hypothetical protein
MARTRLEQWWIFSSRTSSFQQGRRSYDSHEGARPKSSANGRKGPAFRQTLLLDGRAQRRRSFKREHVRECIDTAGVESRACLLVEEDKRLLGTPSHTINARGDECVVDVADGEDAGVEIKLVSAKPLGITLAVQALVMIVHKAEHTFREPAKLAKEPAPVLRMALNKRVFLFVQGPWLLQNLVRHGELADVVQEAAGRERSKPSGWETEFLADLHGSKRHAAGVLLCVLIFLSQAKRERADVRAQEALLRRDEHASPKVADERTGLDTAVQVEGNCAADESDPRDLEAMSNPPTELTEVEQEGRDECARQPPETEQDEEVGAAMREQERVQSTQCENPVEAKANDKQDQRGRTGRRRDCGNETGENQADKAEDGDGRQQDSLEPEKRLDALRAAKHGQRREREDGSTNRERRAARERDDAVEAEDDFRRRKPVESEQRGHRREGRAHKHRATILVPDAYRRQGNRRPGGGHRPHTDTKEMDDAGNHDIFGAKELSSRHRQYCHSASEHQDRNDSISHRDRYRPSKPRS